MVARPAGLNRHRPGHRAGVSEPAPEFEPEAYEAWLDLQDVLEERDREYWEANGDGDEE